MMGGVAVGGGGKIVCHVNTLQFNQGSLVKTRFQTVTATSCVLLVGQWWWGGVGLGGVGWGVVVNVNLPNLTCLS